MKKLLTPLWIALILLIAASLVVEFTLISGHHGPHYWWHDIPAFWILFGFLGCLSIIAFAKFLLNKLVDRKEDYYERL